MLRQTKIQIAQLGNALDAAPKIILSQNFPSHLKTEKRKTAKLLKTASMITLKYFLADAAKHKARIHQLDFIGALLQANVKNRVFVKLDMRYAAYFPEYSQYFGRALKVLKSMYGMTNYGKLFADELTEWLKKEDFVQSQCQMSIYYKYEPDGSKIVVLSYVDDCV